MSAVPRSQLAEQFDPKRLNQDPEADVHHFLIGQQTFRVIGVDPPDALKELYNHLNSPVSTHKADSSTWGKLYGVSDQLTDASDIKKQVLPEWFLAQERRTICSVPLISWIGVVGLKAPPDMKNLKNESGQAI